MSQSLGKRTNLELVLFGVAAAVLLMPGVAHAQTMDAAWTVLDKVRTLVVAPLVVLSFVVSLGAVIFKPDAAKSAIYTLLGGIVVFGVMSWAKQMVGWLG